MTEEVILFIGSHRAAVLWAHEEGMTRAEFSRLVILHSAAWRSLRGVRGPVRVVYSGEELSYLSEKEAEKALALVDSINASL